MEFNLAQVHESIAERFGIEFLPTTTRTVSIPIGRDHPVFFGSRSIIYGNGCTIATHEQWAQTLDEITELIKAHRTTLLFVNTRRLVERVAADRAAGAIKVVLEP